MWWVDQDYLLLMSVLGESPLSTGMKLAYFPVNPLRVLADSKVLTAMELLRRHKFDSTVPLVVRVDERGRPIDHHGLCC